MKVRSLLLSMCAIAALASCSKNDDGIPGGGSDAPEAKVILKLVGNSDQVTSKAAGIPGNLDTDNGKVNNLTVFIFNQSGLVITKQYIGTPATGANSISTTTDAKKVAVVANTGDLTTSGGAFASVSSEDALKAVLSDMLVDPDNKSGAVTHRDANLYMSGIGDLSPFTPTGDQGTQVATTTVQLHYLSARIQLTEIRFNGGTVTDNVYAQANDFATNADANFTIKRVYLMNAQRVTHFLSATDGSGYITQDLKQYTGGVEWSAPWTGQAPNQFKPNNEYTIEASTDKFIPGSGSTANTISEIGHWYTFANTGVSEITNHPTALVVEVLWRKTKADTGAGVAEELQPMYFTTYFGGGDKAELEAGKAYTVKLALNGNFKPTNEGGSGGGGTTDPTKPTVNSSVEVTVTAATWTLVADISKEWK